MGINTAVTHASERPWPVALIKRLPLAFQPAAREHADATEEQLKALTDESDRVLVYRALDDIRETEAGAEALLSVMKTASLSERLMIATRFGEFGASFASPLPGVKPRDPRYSLALYVKVVRALEEQIHFAPDTEYSVEILTELMKLERRRLQPLIESRLSRAIARGDARSADILRRKSTELFFGRVSLPEFAYRAPPLFEVLPESRNKISVVVFGDFGTGRPEQYETAAGMRAYHAKRPFDLGLTVGDNFYAFGLDDPAHARWKSQWEDPYGPLGIKFYATFGNHDYMSLDSPAAQIAYANKSSTWRLPAPFYTFTAGAAQFFALDTQALYDDQLRWLGSALKQSRAKWKVVYGHHPIYIATANASLLESKPDSMRVRLLPVLKQGHADVYLAGHQHSLQELQPEDGVHFFVTGAGGASLSKSSKHSPRAAFVSDVYGFGVLDVSDEALSISFVAADGTLLHRRHIRR